MLAILATDDCGVIKRNLISLRKSDLEPEIDCLLD